MHLAVSNTTLVFLLLNFTFIFIILSTIFSFSFSVNKQLLLAAKRGDIEGVKQALKNGADVNYKDSYGWTALMFAAFEQNVV